MIYSKTYVMPAVDEAEVLRYAGVRDASDEVISLMRQMICESEHMLSCKTCRGEFPVSINGDTVSLGFASVRSRALAKNLSGCSRAVIFASTVGIELDRAIARYGIESPTKALMLQAIGAERIEALCNELSRELEEQAAKEECSLAPRFSPGYGDLPLELQRDIFGVLDCGRRIGLMLNESLLMSPSKSVTAIIGIKNTQK